MSTIRLDVIVHKAKNINSSSTGEEITITGVEVTPLYPDGTPAYEEFLALTTAQQQALLFTALEEQEEYDLLAVLRDSHEVGPEELTKHL